jgi:hypothetical protein
MKKKRQPWQNFTRATGRKGFDYRRSLLQPFEKNIKRKITVRVKRPAVIMETVKSAWQFTGHTRSMFPIA